MTVAVVVDHFYLFFFHFLVQETNISNTSQPMPTLPNDHHHYAPIFQSADSIFTPPLPLADAAADANSIIFFFPLLIQFCTHLQMLLPLPQPQRQRQKER